RTSAAVFSRFLCAHRHRFPSALRRPCGVDAIPYAQTPAGSWLLLLPDTGCCFALLETMLLKQCHSRGTCGLRDKPAGRQERCNRCRYGMGASPDGVELSAP